ncbi:PREDICTED: thionin-like protein 2 [Camelina sativa]|uniref:Thionin-like protein 2 n=1 Tax=Camelina sativa TaxID=90675 RepID=A0ABM0VXR5_CAMSA|nr:PREDICTED: thionin-like protein 2 [Camelina sativa]
MECQRMVMFVTMMIVMAMGNLLIEAEAQAPPPPSHPFKTCYGGCVVGCLYQKTFPKILWCPLTCVGTCLFPQMSSPPSQMVSTNEIDHTDYYCKLGCAAHHCVSLSSIQNPNVEKVSDCVDSCSDKCSTKN